MSIFKFYANNLDKNKVYDKSTCWDYLQEYADDSRKALSALDPLALANAVGALRACTGTVWVAGNGGSGSIGDHMVADFSKGTAGARSHVRMLNLASNTALVSAIANDLHHKEIFAAQLELFAKFGDVLVAISASGNSSNVIVAVEQAKRMGLTTIGLTGFDGGKVAEIVDISLHVPASNYGVAEDAHQTILHAISQYLKVT